MTPHVAAVLFWWTSQTSAVLIDQVREPPDATETNSVAETGENELCGATPLSTLNLVIVLKQVRFVAMLPCHSQFVPAAALSALTCCYVCRNFKAVIHFSCYEYVTYVLSCCNSTGIMLATCKHFELSSLCYCNLPMPASFCCDAVPLRPNVIIRTCNERIAICANEATLDVIQARLTNRQTQRCTLLVGTACNLDWRRQAC